jgi:hypothetical protein
MVANKVYIRGYQTTTKITLMHKKVYIDTKKVNIFDEKVYIYQNMPKSSCEVKQCEPR